MTDSTRTHAERLAAEKYNGTDGPRLHSMVVVSLERRAFVSGYLAGRTVSDEQIDKAASGIADCVQGRLGSRPDPVEVWYMADAAFRAAGLRIEGEE